MNWKQPIITFIAGLSVKNTTTLLKLDKVKSKFQPQLWLSHKRERKGDRERMSVCMCVCNKAEWDFAAHPHGSTGVREKKERRETKDYSIFYKTLANTFISVGINRAGPLLPNDVGRDFTFAPISFLSLLRFFFLLHCFCSPHSVFLSLAPVCRCVWLGERFCPGMPTKKRC